MRPAPLQAHGARSPEHALCWHITRAFQRRWGMLMSVPLVAVPSFGFFGRCCSSVRTPWLTVAPVSEPSGRGAGLGLAGLIHGFSLAQSDGWGDAVTLDTDLRPHSFWPPSIRGRSVIATLCCHSTS